MVLQYAFLHRDLGALCRIRLASASFSYDHTWSQIHEHQAPDKRADQSDYGPAPALFHKDVLQGDAARHGELPARVRLVGLCPIRHWLPRAASRFLPRKPSPE